MKAILAVWLGLGVALTAAAGTVDNSALEQDTFRAHRATYGLVYLLPREVTAALEDKVYPRVRARLASLGLDHEANAFNLPHVTVVHLHNADPATPERMLKALPGVPPVLKLQLRDFYLTSATKGADVPWWLDLGVVKQGPGYDAMMAYNTRASAALTPLRDGPLPRCTGPVFARMSEAARELVREYGVSGINVMRDGKEVTAHNPHHTLVYSMTPPDVATGAALQALAGELNALLPDGLEAEFRHISIVEIGFMGNVLREFYRINLDNGEVRDVASGRRISTQ